MRARSLSKHHGQGGHRWQHFFGHLRIFVYVIILLVAIDLLTGTDDLWVHWVAGIWGAILAMHLVETIFFGGGMFGGSDHSRTNEESASPIERE